MPGFAEVSFKGTRRGYFSFDALDLSPGDPVIVQADRGEDLGRVTALGSIAERKCSTSGGCSTPTPTQRVIRRAGEEEVLRAGHKGDDERRARQETRKHVARHRLKMKVTETEWQFDRKKLIIYFTAEEAGGLPCAREGLGADLPHPHRAQADRGPGRGRASGGSGAVRPRVVLLHMAPRAQAGQPAARQGPKPVAQPRADIGLLRPSHVLSHVRTRQLRGGASQVPPRGPDAPYRPRPRERWWASTSSTTRLRCEATRETSAW